MRIYVGNLPYDVGSDDLAALFEQHGEVASADVITDRDTGRPRGFAFVEMPNRNEAEQAIQALNGIEVGGRTIVVNEARPRGGRGPGGGRGRVDRW